jgi:Trk K+ transport system NAD-binding subunit
MDVPKGHFIVIGMGHVAFRVAELLHQIGEPFCVVTLTLREEWRATIERWAMRLVIGDAHSETNLVEAGIENARAVLILTQDDLSNMELCLDLQRNRPNIPLIVRIFDEVLAHRLSKERSVQGVFSPALLAAPLFVTGIREELQDWVSLRKHDIVSVRVRFEENTAGVGETLADYCKERDVLPLRVSWGVAEVEHRLAAGDVVVFLGTETVLAKSGFLLHGDFLKRKRERLQIGYSLRHLRTRFAELPRLLRVALWLQTLILVASVAVFHYALLAERSWIDAIYFVVTIMTTIGFGDINFLSAPGWLKLFGCLVMVSSATMMAILYGVITDMLVGMRVDEALGRRPTQLSNHCVVVGLGDVGTRVAEKLLQMGEAVVAIERDPDHEALPTLQDRIQVIIADANRESTLHRANVGAARAVLVMTTNDLDNLRIAHLAEQIQPNVATVVRIYNTSLAEKLAADMHIHGTVNAAGVAAATYVASALFTDVEYAVRHGEGLLVLRWRERGSGRYILVHEGERELVVEYYDPKHRTLGDPPLLEGHR